MLKKILIVVLVLVGALVLIGFILPTRYACRRSIVIQADASRVHEFVGDLRRWDDWAPWKGEDPTVQVRFGERTSGVGASQRWTGESGAGRLTFTRSDPATGITYDMAFLHGDSEALAKGWVTYEPAATGVEVEWGMEGDMVMPVLGGYFALLADSMIGPMFMQGLERLKACAEAR